MQVYVLTSRPLPPGTPPEVRVVRDGPAGLAGQLRSRGSDGHVHLVGGPPAIRALAGLGALDRLDLLVLPVLLGDGVPLSPRQAPPLPLRLLGVGRTFPDGTAELRYAPAGPAGRC